MIGILILTHGDLARGYLSAMNLIIGEAKNTDYLGLYHETSIEDYKSNVTKKIKQMNQGEGVLVFCDIFGASPYNVTAQSYPELKGVVDYRSITGVNLPMILEAIVGRETMKLDQLSDYIQQVGKESIKELHSLLERKD